MSSPEGSVKEVRIAMTPSEEKAISRLQTRRKRQLRRKGGAAEGGEEEVPLVPESNSFTNVTKESAPAPSVPSVTPPAPPAAPVVPTAAANIVQTPAPQSAGALTVKIQAKKKGASDPIPAPSQSLIPSGTARILPRKRHQTVKRKPTLVIRGGSQAEPAVPNTPPVPASAPTPSAAAIAATVANAPKPVSATNTESVAASVPSLIGGASQKAKKILTKKRRFTERRMSISVKSMEATRKQKKNIRKKIKSMTTEEIRKFLLKKGILKSTSNPPEKILRSMMKDFLQLHQ